MQISQEELERRLKSPTNLLNRIGVTPISETPKSKGNDVNNSLGAGRKPEIPNAPPSLRVVAGVLAKAEGNSTQVAENLNLTPEQVRYAKGKNEKLTEKKVQEIALTRLMDSLNLLTPATIANEKPRDIANIAANLSKVHHNLRTDNEGDNKKGVNVIIYTPQQKKIEDYEIIEVQSA